jgi:hypothetical protein
LERRESNILEISAGNNLDFIYDKNYDNNKYEIIGLRLFKVKQEDGIYLAKIDDLDALIYGAQQLKKDLIEFNR